MYPVLLLTYVLLLSNDISTTELRHRENCTLVDDHQGNTDIMYVYRRSVVDIACVVEEPKNGAVLSMEYQGNSKKHYFSLTPTKEEKMRINLDLSDDKKELQCCYEYNKDRYCRYVQFTVVINTNPDPRPDCVIVEVPTVAKVNSIRHSRMDNEGCNITVNSKEVALGDYLNATCQSRRNDSTLNWYLKIHNRSITKDYELKSYVTPSKKQQLYLMFTTLYVERNANILCALNGNTANPCGSFSMKMKRMVTHTRKGDKDRMDTSPTEINSVLEANTNYTNVPEDNASGSLGAGRKQLLLGCVVIIVIIAITVTSAWIYLKKKKRKGSRVIQQKIELIYADLALEPNPNAEVRGAERTQYAEIVGVLKIDYTVKGS